MIERETYVNSKEQTNEIRTLRWFFYIPTPTLVAVMGSPISVTISGNLLNFGQLFNAFGST